MKAEELFRLSTHTEGMDLVLEREGAEFWLVLDFWGNGTREAAELSVNDRMRLARALAKSVRDERVPGSTGQKERADGE